MITIYTRPNCSFCDAAKNEMRSRNITFTEKVLGLDFLREDVIRSFPTMKTYPIIVADGNLIGGYTEFMAEINKGNSFGRILLNE